jgi:hypothetical protein
MPTPPKPTAPTPKAPPAGDFEIVDEASLQTAVDAVAMVEDPDEQRQLREFIVEKALELGLEDKLPADWPEVSGNPA